MVPGPGFPREPAKGDIFQSSKPSSKPNFVKLRVVDLFSLKP